MNVKELIYTYGKYIYNYALRLSCHPSTAEDLCQETFTKAWQKIDTLKNPNAIKAWLRKICFNNFLVNERKKGNSVQRPFDDEIQELEKEGEFYINSYPRPEDQVIVRESVSEMQNGCFLAMVRYLTLNQRMTFSLIDMFGLSLQEVSQILNISKGAVKGLLYRAHMNLDSFFQDHCSILDVENPCRCEAWIEFYSRRQTLQDKVQTVKTLNYKKSGYVFNKYTFNKIKYLYKNMPEKRPSDDWYQKIVDSLKN